MNACLVARTTVHHSPGGVQEDLRALAEGLVARGARVVVLTSRHREGCRELEAGGVRYRFLEGTRPESYGGGFFERAYREFERLHRGTPFDVVLGETIALAAFCGRVAVPLVSRFHGLWLGWRSSEALYRRPAWRSLTWAERARALRSLPREIVQGLSGHRLSRRLYRASAAVVLDSEFSRRLLLEHAPWIDAGRVRVIPPGIDTARFRPAEREAARSRLGLSGPVLLFLGRLTLAKGPAVALRAFEGLDVPEAHLVIAGTGRQLPWLRRYAAARRIERVRFAGFVPDEERALYYSAADLFVYPEVTDPAFGLVAAEALACETPVVASAAGAIPEVVGECGFLVPRGDAGALRERIREALKEPGRLRELGRRGRERVEARFSRPRMVGAMVELTEALRARNLG